MKTDFIGNELHIGDNVIWATNSEMPDCKLHFMYARVTGFTEKKVIIEVYTDKTYMKQHTRWSNDSCERKVPNDKLILYIKPTIV